MVECARMWRALAGLPAVVVLTVSLYYGIPYFKDNNETYQSYAQGVNLLHDGAKYSFVTVNGVRGELYPYTHNPNFPRYIHALLLLVGIDDLAIHVAIIAVAASA